jgi:hypothetical protein
MEGALTQPLTKMSAGLDKSVAPKVTLEDCVKYLSNALLAPISLMVSMQSIKPPSRSIAKTPAWCAKRGVRIMVLLEGRDILAQ